MKLKTLIIKACFQIIDKLIDESQIVEPDPELMKQIEELVDGVDIDSHECTGCEHNGGLTIDCMAPSLTPCPKQ